MTRTLLVAGTASHVGKSTIVAGICRQLADSGIDVAPFKAQNMSNNAQVAVTPDGGWGEIGVSQYVQARAARVLPTTDMNPVLLKPRGDGESQLIVDGAAVGTVEAGTYYEGSWDRARQAAEAAFDRLASSVDVVVAEGAGSIAEINLHERDLANVETARFADAAIVLVGDLERGGAFASLFGTLALLPSDLEARVEGFLLNKFRGDRALLDPGIFELEDRTGIPVLGVLPFDDPGLPAEDSVSLPSVGDRETLGVDDVPSDRTVTIGVPRLPQLSNAADLDPLTREPGVRVAIRPPEASFADADALVVPGTKNTVDDLLALREVGFDATLGSFEGPIVGICGGYQLLGERLENAAVEGTGDRPTIEGFGLLPVKTRFSTEKSVTRTTVSVAGAGPIDGASGTASGYEIHMGTTTRLEDRPSPLGEQSVATDSVLGTYLHGLFENRVVRAAFLDAVFDHAGKTRPGAERPSHTPYANAVSLVSPVDWKRLLQPVGAAGEE